jgi:hypothetical protein
MSLCSPLRAIPQIRGLAVMVSTLLASLRALANVALLFMFFFVGKWGQNKKNRVTLSCVTRSM